MKKLLMFLFVITLGGVLFIQSCSLINNNCNPDYYFDHDNLFSFEVLSETGNNILKIGQTKYNYDTVRILNEDYKTVAYPPDGTEWSSYSGNILLEFIEPADEGVIDKRISRSFYLYFNHHDTDTIDISFEMIINDCGEQAMKYFKVSYNDSIYFDNNVSDVPLIDFVKAQ